MAQDIQDIQGCHPCILLNSYQHSIIHGQFYSLLPIRCDIPESNRCGNNAQLQSSFYTNSHRLHDDGSHNLAKALTVYFYPNFRGYRYHSCSSTTMSIRNHYKRLTLFKDADILLWNYPPKLIGSDEAIVSHGRLVPKPLFFMLPCF